MHQRAYPKGERGNELNNCKIMGKFAGVTPFTCVKSMIHGWPRSHSTGEFSCSYRRFRESPIHVMCATAESVPKNSEFIESGPLPIIAIVEILIVHESKQIRRSSPHLRTASLLSSITGVMISKLCPVSSVLWSSRGIFEGCSHYRPHEMQCAESTRCHNRVYLCWHEPGPGGPTWIWNIHTIIFF